MKELIKHHVMSAYFNYSPEHRMSFAYAAGHARLMNWILDTKEFTFAQYEKAAKEQGVTHMNEEFFNKAIKES